MSKSPYIIVKNLHLQGLNKNYFAEFKPGLNVIWGDMDTGKSSILNLIDYCLGGSNRHLMYGEIKAGARIAFLEIDLNGNVCTFERIIADENAPIKAYNCAYEEIPQHFPMILSPGSDENLPDGWVSDFILDKLTISKVKIRESTRNPNSRAHRLSFRDLMKHIYLRQTKIGAESLYDYTNPPLFNKNVEIQKYIYNIHDDRLAESQVQLNVAQSELNQLNDKLSTVKNFLSSVNINDDKDILNIEIISLGQDISQLDVAIKSIKEDFALSSGVSSEVYRKILELKSDIKHLVKDIDKKDSEIINLLSLKKTYDSDINSLKISEVVRDNIDIRNINTDLRLKCPLCLSSLELSNPIIPTEYITHEIASINNRISGVSNAIENLTRQKYELNNNLLEQTKTLEDLTRLFDEENEVNLSPLVTNIQILEIQKSEIINKIDGLKKEIVLLNKLTDIDGSVEDKKSLVDKIKRDIKKITEELKGLDDVIKELSNIYVDYLNHTGLQKNFGAYIDKKFTLFFRDISYYNISSGGVRTILSILSFLTRLHYLILNEGNLPTLFMLDTPGQNIGRAARLDEVSGVEIYDQPVDPETSDPALYDKIYKQLLSVIHIAKDNESNCQIIVVDNDLPSFLAEGDDFHLVKRFSKAGVKYDIGLINDAI